MRDAFGDALALGTARYDAADESAAARTEAAANERSSPVRMQVFFMAPRIPGGRR
jgi:hypothetical protein